MSQENPTGSTRVSWMIGDSIIDLDTAIENTNPSEFVNTTTTPFIHRMWVSSPELGNNSDSGNSLSIGSGSVSEANDFADSGSGGGIDLDEFETALSGLMPGNNYTQNGGNSTIDPPPYTLWELINTGEGYLFLGVLLTAGELIITMFD